MAELFLEIVNMSISAGWIVLVVLLLRFALKKAPKWITVLLWGVVAVRLVLPVTVESIFSLMPSAETVSPGIMLDPAPEIQTGIPVLNETLNPIISGSFAPNPGDSVNPLQILIPVFAVLWVAGAAAMLAYTAITYWRLRRRVSTAVRMEGNIFQSEQVVSPFVLGIFRPRIYLPFAMGEQDRTHVIAHEQAHLRRKDHLWKPLGFLLLTVYWFNPLMWLAYVLLCRDIELACDEKVVKELDTQQRADYSQALLTCSVNRRMIAACPLAFGEVGVKNRVKSVLNYKKPAFWLIIIAIIVSIAVAVCFLTNPKDKSAPYKALYKAFLAGEVNAISGNEEVSVEMYTRPDLGNTDYQYTIYDMTGDDIPELCIRRMPYMYFFTVKNDELHSVHADKLGDIYSWHTEFALYCKILNNGAILYERRSGGPTHINYQYSELDENGSVAFTIMFAWYDGSTMEDSKVYPDIYLVNGQEVSKEEYEAITQKYLQIGSNRVTWYDKDGNVHKDSCAYIPAE